MSEFVTIRVWEDGYKELVHDYAMDFGNDREKLTAKCHKFYKSEEKSPWYFLEKAKEKIEVLEKQNEIMREALEFYQDPHNWRLSDSDECSVVDDDDLGAKIYENLFYLTGGKKARKALKEIKEISNE